MLESPHPEFIGIESLIRQHAEQIAQFAAWSAAGDWQSFHDNHYDWWAFPIDRPSSLGFAYSISQPDIECLKADAGFLTTHALGAQLLLLAWGWDSETGSAVRNPSPGQTWFGWPIRLEKCARSMALLGQAAELEQCQKYAGVLRARGESFDYSGRDLYTDIADYSV